MARRPNPVPTYRLHRRTGRAAVMVYNHLGRRTEVLLPGAYDSQESHAEYQRLLVLLRCNQGRLPAPKHVPADLTVAELVLRYLRDHVLAYYVDQATDRPTNEQEVIKLALKPVVRLFGSTLAREFGAAQLEAVQQAMITGAYLTDDERKLREKEGRPLGLARTTINRQVSRIRGMVKWAVTKRLVPADLLVELQAVASLKRGRTKARETAPVAPVEMEVIEQTLPFLPCVVRDMVKVQLASGARPGEICAMKAGEIDRTGPVWIYRPSSHKGSYRGHQRNIALGPKCQLVLRQYLSDDQDPDAYVFSPALQDRLIKERMRAERKSKVQPSQRDRSKAGAQRKPGERFHVRAYNRAVQRGCEKANVTPWHVHQLRHTAALLIEREVGVEAARATLGHKLVNVTAMYSGLDLKRAVEVAAKMG